MSRFVSRLSTLLPITALLLLTAGLTGCHRKDHWHLSNVSHIVAPLQFSLQSTEGGTQTAKDFRGKVVAMYFGYTHCPDVCPTTLAKLSGAIKQLGPQAKDVRVLFVTVDPQRDTMPVLKRYVHAFDPTHFVGLRGDASATAAIAKRYRVGYTDGKKDADGDYSVSHSSGVFIFDRQGDARLLGTETTPESDYVTDLKQLLSQEGDLSVNDRNGPAHPTAENPER